MAARREATSSTTGNAAGRLGQNAANGTMGDRRGRRFSILYAAQRGQHGRRGPIERASPRKGCKRNELLRIGRRQQRSHIGRQYLLGHLLISGQAGSGWVFGRNAMPSS
jgi:hypothetical protein